MNYLIRTFPYFLLLFGVSWMFWGLDTFLGGLYVSDEDYSSGVRIFELLSVKRDLSRAWWFIPFWFDKVYSLFGFSVIAGRISCVFLSLFGLVGLYVFVRQNFQSKQIAIWSVALCGISIHYVFFARLALEHAAAFALIPLWLIFFESFLKHKKPIIGVGLALVSVPLLFSYPGTRVFVVSWFLSRYLFLGLQTGWMQALKHLAKVGVVFASGVIVYVFYFHMQYGFSSIRYYGGGFFVKDFLEPFKNAGILILETFIKTQSWILPHFDKPFYGFLPLGLFCCGSYLSLKRKHPLLTSLVFSVLIFIGLSTLARDYPGMRRATLTLFPFSIVCAFAAGEIIGFLKRKNPFYPLVFVVLIMISTFSNVKVFFQEANYNFGSIILGRPIPLDIINEFETIYLSDREYYVNHYFLSFIFLNQRYGLLDSSRNFSVKVVYPEEVGSLSGGVFIASQEFTMKYVITLIEQTQNISLRHSTERVQKRGSFYVLLL